MKRNINMNFLLPWKKNQTQKFVLVKFNDNYYFCKFIFSNRNKVVRIPMRTKKYLYRQQTVKIELEKNRSKDWALWDAA